MSVRKSDIEKDFANFSEYSITLPENWFDDIKDDEINNVKKKIRDTFNYRQRKIKSDNPNYSYLLKLFALGYRYPRIKQWLNNLINEFKINLHKIFEDNISRMAFVFYKMSAFGELPFDIYIEKSNIIPFLLFNGKSYENLTNDEKEECLSFFVLLSEIFVLNTLIRQRLDKIEKNVNLTIESYHVGISDLYNYLDKLDCIFKRLVNSSILNKPVKSYEKIRNSIIHSHFVPDWSKTMSNDEGKRLLTLRLVDWNQSNWDNNTTNRLRYKCVGMIEDSTSKVFREMTIIVSIISQIISLYGYFSQSEPRKHK